MPVLNFDFVYMREAAEFITANITLDIVSDKAAGCRYELLITTEDEISNAEVMSIVDELAQKNFKKMDIDMARDCKIKVSAAGRTYDVDFLGKG